MKLAIFSESSADEAALRLLVDALLGKSTDSVGLTWLRTRGWPSVRQTLGKVIAHLYYHTDADGLVVVADSNGSPPHEPSHDTSPPRPADCRLCELRSERDRAVTYLRAVPHRAPLNIAVGIASPAIEAWLRFGLDVHVTEAAWFRGRANNQPPFTRALLKQAVYGTSRPSLETEKKRMLEEATRLVKMLPGLETAFPIGFGALAEDVRRWRI